MDRWPREAEGTDPGSEGPLRTSAISQTRRWKVWTTSRGSQRCTRARETRASRPCTTPSGGPRMT
eukprot:9474070-Prorocentrum_lima.AAC.1